MTGRSPSGGFEALDVQHRTGSVRRQPDAHALTYIGVGYVQQSMHEDGVGAVELDQPYGHRLRQGILVDSDVAHRPRFDGALGTACRVGRKLAEASLAED